MPSYRAPVEETLFLLFDVLGFERHANLPGFSEASRDVVEAILAEAARVAEKSFQPLNRSGDLQGCERLANGDVVTPNGFKEAYKAFVEGGWIGLAADPEYGGQGLPHTITAAINEYASSANMALAMYPGLTQGAIAALVLHGSDEQKRAYLPNMITGKWTGTMNLTEPHCGTDLGLIKTKAVPQPDGSYKITGQKIFISAGEHDMTENIVHLVLARIEGAPEGTKGISLFVAPKMLFDENGALTTRNAVSCGAVEHKMGIHGNSTCVMHYDGATAGLVGEEHRGLAAMFTMMNEARLGVGIQGLSQSEVAYQNAVAYARERRQGRALTGPKDADKPADALMVHPDVRRTLMSIKAFNEAARALILWTAVRGDVGRVSEDEKERQAADDHMGLMTPIIKGVITDLGFDNTVKAQQMFGGHGYIAEWGMEQFVRDARIAMIYEGANGVQAMDLVGRKLPRHGGRAIMAFFKEVDGFLRDNAEVEGMKPFLEPLKKAREDLQKATMWFMANAMGKPDNAGAGAVDYMHLFGLTALGYMWAMMARTALDKKADGADGVDVRLATGRFFMERMMPETAARLAAISAGSEAVMALPEEAF
ncbi:acyl-CoA dehydrogenase C-terminal domain-containing protein [Hansschlegelia zhihuaiae]|uniref:3-methylmercaptopropionyl-CoA dehydrogenase n=1 Tax=Hansschlegelia zhihuaiae TaxID=405005 RepID=A0A4V1KHV0_9HYPH|nr:acyl-CoA dehydrogenase C-terminal domain-containing protein [Hansschlegelia zhihuaiae]RXF68462.1 acyl-CoA dehydrogenase [Hansschlegelia zhihuaiae]